MKGVFLVHWHAEEAAARCARLQALGYRVRHESGQDGEAARAMKRALAEVDAVVIDLARLPSHGRQFAIALRQQKATRHLPLVFLQGDPEKTSRVKEALPDAVFTTWAKVAPALKKALAKPVAAPVVPAMPDYSGTPLPKKLGIRAGAKVVLLGAPPDFAATLGELPEGATLTTRLVGQPDVVLLFSRALADLQRRLPPVVEVIEPGGGLWLCWPKKTAGVQTDLDANVVRALGLDAGLVDNKVCAVDATWSGLRFARRRR